ncbi:MAG: hypothetical protein J5712_05950 [Lachnospiraceae bacterium]|nr:hypothetical protein [Lachnospiraceae bacterium]
MKLIIETFWGIAVGILLTVPIHEIGHLLGGVLTGYRLTSIGILGVYLCRDADGFRLKKRKDAPIGQCIMYPDRPDRTPVMLIAGGILANLAAGALFTWLGVRAESIDTTAVFLSAGGIMAALGILNAVPYSRTNDASTFRDIVRFEGAGKLYNRLMCVYSELENGRVPAGLSARNLKLGVDIGKGRVRIDSGHFLGCAIAEELLYYRHLKESEIIGENKGVLREESAYDI